MAAAAEAKPPSSGETGAAVAEKSSQNSDSIRYVSDEPDQLHRHLGNRQIQLIAIGGSIGTGLFVSIGGGLVAGGPANLLLGYSTHCLMVCLINNSLAEMVCYMPIGGSFIRMAGKWVDESLGFLAGWNFFLYEAILIPYEISALNLIITFWTDKIPVAAICVIVIVLYAIINILAVQYYGEAEFWLATGKLLLILIVFFFTFITAVGGNPQHEPYGFRYWYSPGPFVERIHTGTLGRFEGYLGSLFSACFTVVGPEYIAMVAGEAERPRIYIKNGFKTVYWRFFVFFVLSALAVGIVVASNDAQLINNGSGTAKGSPYVIAMQNMGVEVLPHIVNALLLTSIFSAGNAYVYCAMRSLHGLACEGQAPRIFKKTLKNGIPIYAFGVTMLFPFLSFLQVSGNTAGAVTTLQSVTEGATMINYICISLTYIFFYNACKAQGVDRKTFPYVGWFQPYCAYITFVYMIIIEGIFGYVVFVPGHWSVADFFPPYTMAFVTILLYFGWKIIKRTKFVKPHEADLVWEKPQIDAYEAQFTEPPSRFRDEIAAIFTGKMRAKETHMGEDIS
ncbi:histidine permease [Xylaria venustula]|nr:histidine permease [Xylaria venustula]